MNDNLHKRSKSFYKNILICMICLILLSGCGSTQDIELSYTNTDTLGAFDMNSVNEIMYGISDEWVVIHANDDEYISNEFTYDNDEEIYYIINAMSYINFSGSEQVFLDHYSEDLFQVCGDSSQIIKKEKWNNGDFEGTEICWIEEGIPKGVFKDNAQTLYGKAVLFKYNSSFYVFNILYEDEKYLNVFEKFLTSIKTIENEI